jgi:drug/metabolite transporter (DMT)-like permease
MNYGLIVATILAFGFSAFFRKLAVDRIHPFHLQIIAAMVYTSLIPIWYNVAPKQFEFSWSGVAFGILCTGIHILGAVMFGLLLKSNNSTGMLSVMVSSSPVVTILLSMLFLQEKFEARHVVATLLTLSGLALFNYHK